MAKDIDSINRQLGEAVVGAANEHHEEMEQIREAAQQSGYAASKVPSYVTEPALRERMAEDARRADENAAHEKARNRAEAAFERYPQEVAARRKELGEALFANSSANSSDLTVKTALASGEELHSLVSAASQTGDAELARAVFVEADRRERTAPDGSETASESARLKRWIADEFGGRFAEWLMAPTDEEAERHVQVQRSMLNEALKLPMLSRTGRA